MLSSASKGEILEDLDQIREGKHVSRFIIAEIDENSNKEINDNYCTSKASFDAPKSKKK